ncbi:MAG: terminase small subunit [bacterium]|nr:terminase small subunit [bacterium]MDY2830910.1 terminase small subunit [Alphaproteobacteria bacterium]
MGLATKVSYAAVADMERRIEQYFAARANSTTEIYSPKKGEVVEVCEQAPLHLTGLCDYLEISAEELDAYQQKPEFAELIRRAKKKCEAYLVDQCVKLHKADFVLKNNFPSVWQESPETALSEDLKKVLVEFVTK